MVEPAEPGLLKHLSRSLHTLDPMRTGCSANNGMEDEYDSEAREIARRLHAGEPLLDAVKQTFDARFWPGCLEEANRSPGLNQLVTAIQAALADGDH